jgi:hypothetical protein
MRKIAKWGVLFSLLLLFAGPAGADSLYEASLLGASVNRYQVGLDEITQTPTQTLEATFTADLIFTMLLNGGGGQLVSFELLSANYNEFLDVADYDVLGNTALYVLQPLSLGVEFEGTLVDPVSGPGDYVSLGFHYPPIVPDPFLGNFYLLVADTSSGILYELSDATGAQFQPPTLVPEPATMSVLGFGLGLIAVRGIRKRLSRKG